MNLKRQANHACYDLGRLCKLQEARERERELKKDRDEQHQAKQQLDRLKAANGQLTTIISKINNLKGLFRRKLD